ncbi:MAG: cytochrome c3 family protein [Phycisphaerae bacterium]
MKQILILLFALLSIKVFAIERIANSKHDLSVYSPNAIRGVNEEEICIFCHTPHKAQPQTPLWNRHSPTAYYRIYRSSTTDARIEQPFGPSKMCLSCHDGTLALGLVRSRPATDPIAMTSFTMPPGPSNLTTDLSDDHPIGFRYDLALANADLQLRNPQEISRKLDLGPHNEVHCTTCHDPHNNQLGNFLRLPDRKGVLCTSCHKMLGWPISAHALSVRHIQFRPTLNPDQRPKFATMLDNACLACHQVHGAEGRERLLKFRRDETNCLTCHDGSVGSDILSVMRLPYNHRGNPFVDLHNPVENPRVMPTHVTCDDCHNPHAVQPDFLGGTLGTTVPGVSGPLQKVPGVGIQGNLIPVSRFEYEICFRCHADKPVPIVGATSRVNFSVNIRRQVNPSAASSHPFALPHNSNDVPSLDPALRGRMIGCNSCHNSNISRDFGGPGPNGPHGSAFDFILALRYETRDFTTESASAYALCYRCHERSSILANDSFSLHRRHIVNLRTPCNVCHDPHGVTGPGVNGSHLINFDRSIVFRAPGTSRIEYRDIGRFQGTCTLKCHGVNHINFQYTPTTPP